MLTFLESGLICVSQTVFPGGTHHVFLHVFWERRWENTGLWAVDMSGCSPAPIFVFGSMFVM